MFKGIILTLILSALSIPAYSGTDHVFEGKKDLWWKLSHSEFYSLLGMKSSVAFVVGVGSYKSTAFSNLPSEKDAVRIKDYLINYAGFDSVHLLTGNKVTRERVYELMEKFGKTLTSKDRFLVYWSGHGVTTSGGKKKLGYLALSDSTKNKSSMLSMRNLSEWDSQIKAKQTFYLLDACFSGIAASRVMSISKEQTIARVSQPSRQIMVAGQQNQSTIAIDDLDGGVFTKAVLDGLKGHADTNKGFFKKDGVVTARELEEYVRERVDYERRRVGWKERITPILFNFSDYGGDFFFVNDKSKLNKSALLNVEPLSEGVTPSGNYLEGKTNLTLRDIGRIIYKCPEEDFQGGIKIGDYSKNEEYLAKSVKNFWLTRGFLDVVTVVNYDREIGGISPVYQVEIRGNDSWTQNFYTLKNMLMFDGSIDNLRNPRMWGCGNYYETIPPSMLKKIFAPKKNPDEWGW